MAYLPADVITEVLSQLPVTSLLRFRSISKSWQSLIDSHYFTTLHLNKFHKLKSNLNLILHHNSQLYAVDFPTLGNTVHLNHPLMSYENSITLLGSCNGLLCIKNVVDDVAIWSPSLRKHRILPNLPTRRRLMPNISFCASRVHGFGFDPITGDYKLVKISFFVGAGSTFDCKVNLFSCRTNAWKTLPSMPYALCYVETMGVIVDHTLHWVVTRNRILADHKLIVAFDLRFEVFNEVPLPVLGEYFKIDVSQLGGCLCIIVNYENTRIDIWVMKQYGSKDSWFKLFTLVEYIELRSLKSLKPLGYSSDGIKVLFQQDFNKLFWYNLKSKQVGHVTIPGMSNFDGMIEWEALSNHPYPMTIIGSSSRSRSNIHNHPYPMTLTGSRSRSNTLKRRREGA